MKTDALLLPTIILLLIIGVVWLVRRGMKATPRQKIEATYSQEPTELTTASDGPAPSHDEEANHPSASSVNASTIPVSFPISDVAYVFTRFLGPRIRIASNDRIAELSRIYADDKLAKFPEDDTCAKYIYSLLKSRAPDGLAWKIEAVAFDLRSDRDKPLFEAGNIQQVDSLGFILDVQSSDSLDRCFFTVWRSTNQLFVASSSRRLKQSPVTLRPQPNASERMHYQIGRCLNFADLGVAQAAFLKASQTLNQARLEKRVKGWKYGYDIHLYKSNRQFEYQLLWGCSAYFSIAADLELTDDLSSFSGEDFNSSVLKSYLDSSPRLLAGAWFKPL